MNNIIKDHFFLDERGVLFSKRYFKHDSEKINLGMKPYLIKNKNLGNSKLYIVMNYYINEFLC